MLTEAQARELRTLLKDAVITADVPEAIIARSFAMIDAITEAPPLAQLRETLETAQVAYRRACERAGKASPPVYRESPITHRCSECDSPNHRGVACRGYAPGPEGYPTTPVFPAAALAPPTLPWTERTWVETAAIVRVNLRLLISRAVALAHIDTERAAWLGLQLEVLGNAAWIRAHVLMPWGSLRLAPSPVPSLASPLCSRCHGTGRDSCETSGICLSCPD